MSDAETLKSAFLAFSNFGAGANKQKNEMESKNFKKLVQECGLFKKGKLDGAEVDMIFTRCKGPMPCRNILFDSFKDKAIPQLATAVYGDDSEENKKQIIDAITSNSPKVNSSVKMCSIGVVDRLTDPSKYTGAH
ncbi:tubulin polymerization-promoting protein family member 2-like, partial [Symsagittifera roscoffensis]|uniref:tubulin polymerization-promoting protein family member 2-like n=1 Tax=Symsagittifera roscoffensis TaxID=84072 RepID=UPI00307B19B5